MRELLCSGAIHRYQVRGKRPFDPDIIMRKKEKRNGETLFGEGKKSILISAIKNASIFHAIRMQIRMILIVCSVIVHYMRWEINAEGIFDIQRMG